MTNQQIESELLTHFGIIVKLANTMYINNNVSDVDDLMQAGIIGLMKGLQSNTFDPNKENGAKRTTYIIHCIRREMMEEANKFYGVFKLPHEKKLKLNKILKLQDKDMPIDKEKLKKQLSISSKELDELVKLAKVGLTSKLDESIVDKSTNITQELADAISDTTLTIEERKILELRSAGHTYKEIGTFFGLRKEVVRNKFLNILERVKKSNKDKNG